MRARRVQRRSSVTEVLGLDCQGVVKDAPNRNAEGRPLREIDEGTWRKGVTMRAGRLLLVFLLAVGVAMVLGGPVGAQGRPLSTTLTGSAEVPPGDADASGSASLTLNQGQGQVCFALTWENIDGTVVASHIHKAPRSGRSHRGPTICGRFVLGDRKLERLRRGGERGADQGHQAEPSGVLREHPQHRVSRRSDSRATEQVGMRRAESDGLVHRTQLLAHGSLRRSDGRASVPYRMKRPALREQKLRPRSCNRA